MVRSLVSEMPVMLQICHCNTNTSLNATPLLEYIGYKILILPRNIVKNQLSRSYDDVFQILPSQKKLLLVKRIINLIF